MYVHRTYNGKRTPQYTRAQYSKVPVGTLYQPQHRIAESSVPSLISNTLHDIVDYARNDRAEFIRIVQEALRKKGERKEKLHQAYIRRKASGAQKWYEDKIRATKRLK